MSRRRRDVAAVESEWRRRVTVREIVAAERPDFSHAVGRRRTSNVLEMSPLTPCDLCDVRFALVDGFTGSHDPYPTRCRYTERHVSQEVAVDDIGRTPTCDCSRTSTGDSSSSSSHQHANIIDCPKTEQFSHIHRVDPRVGATGFRCHVCSLRQLNLVYLTVVCCIFVVQLIYVSRHEPSDWKRAMSVHKGSIASRPANYRPISLTSVFCKLMERILSKQLISYLRQHGLITRQHGFLLKRSTITNLLECVSDWSLAIKNSRSRPLTSITLRHLILSAVIN
jgi:hypothetical protein